MNYEEKWVLTDDDSFQIRRMVEDGIYELYQIQAIREPLDDEASFKVAHAVIYTSEIDVKNVCDCYGYESLDAVKKEYGDEYKGILAECEFELDALECLLHTPALTWKDARELICKLSGYSKDFM